MNYSIAADYPMPGPHDYTVTIGSIFPSDRRHATVRTTTHVVRRTHCAVVQAVLPHYTEQDAACLIGRLLRGRRLSDSAEVWASVEAQADLRADALEADDAANDPEAPQGWPPLSLETAHIGDTYVRSAIADLARQFACACREDSSLRTAYFRLASQFDGPR